MAGEGGEGEVSATLRPSRFGRFSNIRDFGLVGSGDIRLEHKQRYNLLERAGGIIFMSELDYFLFDKIVIDFSDSLVLGAVCQRVRQQFVRVSRSLAVLKYAT